MTWTAHEDQMLTDNKDVCLRLLKSMLNKTPQQIAKRRFMLNLSNKRVSYNIKDVITKCEDFAQKEFGFSCKKLAGIILRHYAKLT